MQYIFTSLEYSFTSGLADKCDRLISDVESTLTVYISQGYFNY